MVDPVQRTSSLPLPQFQRQDTVHDPNAPKELKRVDGEIKDADKADDADTFEDYLNQASITTLEKNQPSKTFDPVSDVVSSSVYTQPKDKTQF